jgi:hypothetical protein
MKKQHKESGGGCTAFKNTGLECGAQRNRMNGSGGVCAAFKNSVSDFWLMYRNSMREAGVAGSAFKNSASVSALHSRIPSQIA